MNPDLLEAIRFFTREKQIMASLHVTCGKRDSGSAHATDGDRTPGRKADERTLYDLASVTKLFTGMTLMRLKEDGKLDVDRPVTDYAPRFCHLRDVSVASLMTFGVNLKTPGRVDEQKDALDAEACLFEATNEGLPSRRPYSDIPAMVLKYVAEGVTGKPFYEIVREQILLPAGMTETFATIPEERIADCVCYDLEHRIEKDRRKVNTGILPGMPHDPKARKISPHGENLCGHAGLFSTAADLERFCRAVLEGRILREASLREMAVNRTGRRLEDGSWSQFLGIQCYVRHPDQYFSEIPVYESDRAFGIGGFTGNHVSMDPETGIFVIMLGNRVYDRLTVLIPEDGKAFRDYGLNDDGTGAFLWEDGRVIPSSVNYVHQKDEHLHTAVGAVLQTL